MSKVGILNASYHGVAVYVNAYAMEKDGSLAYLDVVGPELTLKAIPAVMSGENIMGSTAVLTEDEDGIVDETIMLRQEDGSTLDVQHQLWRIGKGMGSLSRLVVVVKTAAKTVSDEHGNLTFSVFNKDEALAEEALRSALNSNMPISLTDEQEALLYSMMESDGGITKLKSHGITGYIADFKRKKFYDNYVHKLLGKPVAIKQESLTNFVEKYAQDIVSVIQEKAAPLYDPKVDKMTYVEDRLKTFQRTLFNSQMNVVKALVKAGEKGRKGALLAGEMSVGKTTCFTAFAMALDNRVTRALVTCPPHLTNKWEREILEMVPDALIVKLNDWKAMSKLRGIRALAAENPKRPLFAIMSRTRMRDSEFWEPAHLSRPVHPDYKAALKARYPGEYQKLRFVACTDCNTYLTVEKKDDSGKVAEKLVRVEEMKPVREKCGGCGSPMWQNTHHHESDYDLTLQRKRMLKRWLGDLPVGKQRVLDLIADQARMDDFIALVAKGGLANIVAACEMVIETRFKIRFARLRDAMLNEPFTLTPDEFLPYRYISNHLNGFFHALGCDEAHECKGQATAQGLAFGALAASCGQAIALSGSLSSGFADDLYPLLFRVDPAGMTERGYGFNKQLDYLHGEGVIETVKKTKEEKDHVRTRGKSTQSVRVKRKPGISPVAIAADLLPNTVFIKMEDIQKDAMRLEKESGGDVRLLPSYREVFMRVPMKSEQKAAYDKFANDFDAITKDDKTASVRSRFLHAMLYMPDYPDAPRTITWNQWQGERLVERSITMDYVIGEGELTGKEEELIKLCLKEKAEGRRVMTLVSYTGKFDVMPRMKRVLEAVGLKVAILKNVATSDREEWVNKQVANGVDCIFANMQVIQTGLDLLDFPTICFYQTGVSTFALRQASRRAWRIGQKLPCRVYYMVAADSAQEISSVLMANKQRVAMNTEGDMADSALDSVATMDDGLAAIGRALSAKEAVVLTGSISSIDEDSSDGEYYSNMDLKFKPAVAVPVESIAPVEVKPLTEQDLFLVAAKIEEKECEKLVDAVKRIGGESALSLRARKENAMKKQASLFA